MDMRINIEEAVSALETKPLLSTTYERIFILDRIKGDKRELATPLRFSYMLRTLLSEVSVPLSAHDLIAGRIPDRELNDEEEALYQTFIKHPECPYRGVFCDGGHISYDWEFLLEYGLRGLRTRAEGFLLKQTNSESRDFLAAQLEVYDAIIHYLHRYAEAARAIGNHALASSLLEAADEKPHSFRGALQLLYTVQFIDCAYISRNPTLTLGHMDALLLPFYKKGLADGSLTRKTAKELILDFYCKHNLMMGRGEHQVGNSKNATGFSRICNFDAPQYLLLGGSAGINELTVLFAECIEPRFKNPVIVYYYEKNMAKNHPELWKSLIGKALAGSSMMFYQEDSVRAAFGNTGLAKEQYKNCYHFGCNWASPSTRAAWGQGGPKALLFGAPMSEDEKALLSAPYLRSIDDCDSPETFMNCLSALADKQDLTIDDIEDAFFSKFEEFIDYKFKLLETDIAIRKRRPAAVMTFGDCFFPHTAERGGTHAAISDLFYEFAPLRMFGTTCDCFIVTEDLLFGSQRLTPHQLIKATEENFEGHAELLAYIRSIPKYGSDDEKANAHAKRLAERYVTLIAEKNKQLLPKKLFLVPCMQSDTWHLKLGMKYGATVNGRPRGEAFSQNTRPSNGTCTNGLTGMLNSMLHVTPHGLVSGALNLDVQKSMFEGEERHAVFAALLASYFDRGGLHAQISVTSADELRAAKADPDSHRDLRVRITGYSAVFVDTCEALQDDLIARLEK